MDTADLTNKIKSYGVKLGRLIIDHRVSVTAIVMLFSAGGALLITRDFIDIPRNEERYSEEFLGISYKKIDSEILAEFQTAQQDQTIEVNSNFDPNRSNPFSE